MPTWAQLGVRYDATAVAHGGARSRTPRCPAEWEFPSQDDADRFVAAVRAAGTACTRSGSSASIMAPDLRRGRVVRAAQDVERDGVLRARAGQTFRVTEPYDHNGYVDLVADDGTPSCLHASQVDADEDAWRP